MRLLVAKCETDNTLQTQVDDLRLSLTQSLSVKKEEKAVQTHHEATNDDQDSFSVIKGSPQIMVENLNNEVIEFSSEDVKYKDEDEDEYDGDEQQQSGD